MFLLRASSSSHEQVAFGRSYLAGLGRLPCFFIDEKEPTMDSGFYAHVPDCGRKPRALDIAAQNMANVSTA